MFRRQPMTLLAAALALGALTLTAAVSADRTGSAETDSLARPAAAANAFLRIEGIEGGATRAGHENWIEVVSFNYGLAPALSRPVEPEPPAELSSRMSRSRSPSTSRVLCSPSPAPRAGTIRKPNSCSTLPGALHRSAASGSPT